MNLKWLDTGAQLISGVVELGSQLVGFFLATPHGLQDLSSPTRD